MLRAPERAVITLWAAVVLVATPVFLLSAQSFRVADSIVQSGITRGIYPGAVLVIGTGEGITHARGFGRFEWNRGAVPSPEGTVWDLASLTKVVGTTGAIMRLWETGR